MNRQVALVHGRGGGDVTGMSPSPRSSKPANGLPKPSHGRPNPDLPADDGDDLGQIQPGEDVDPARLKQLAGFSNRELVAQMLKNLGEDPDREGLRRTPYRVEKAMEFLTSGYRTRVEDFLNNALFESPSDQLVVVKEIPFYSLCEHHMLPFTGVAHVGYLPTGSVVGLSKIPRVVDMFARRLQLQERLTIQIADCLNELLKPRGVAVVMEAVHFCMQMRGVQKQNAKTVTSAMLGDFRTDPRTREEFLRLIGNV